MLEGAIVIVGATAPGLQDLRSTPFGSVYPGVEIHANVLADLNISPIESSDGQRAIEGEFHVACTRSLLASHRDLFGDISCWIDLFSQ